MSTPSSDGAALANVELFQGLDRRELQRLESIARRRTYDTGQVILREGDTGIGLFLVLKGKVRVTQGDGTPQARELATIGEGGAFGEMALFRDFGRRSATVTAVEPTECLVLHRLDFLDQLRSNPEIAIKLLDTLSQRVSAAQQSM